MVTLAGSLLTALENLDALRTESPGRGTEYGLECRSS